MDSDELLGVSCPTCGAAPGWWCAADEPEVSRDGEPFGLVHTARAVRAAAKRLGIPASELSERMDEVGRELAEWVVCNVIGARALTPGEVADSFAALHNEQLERLGYATRVVGVTVQGDDLVARLRGPLPEILTLNPPKGQG